MGERKGRYTGPEFFFQMPKISCSGWGKEIGKFLVKENFNPPYMI
jgi:hypothetical protein